MARRERFTKTLVDSLEVAAGEYSVWDTDVPALACRVRGRAKYYLLRLRVDGRQRWYRIGKHGQPWTVDTARDEARRVLGQGANVDRLRETGSAPPTLLHPIEAREQQKETPTLSEFAQRYLDEYAEPHKGAGTLAADEGLLGLKAKATTRRDTASKKKRRKGAAAAARKEKVRTILQALGSKRVDRITRADVTELHLSWKYTRTRANRALALLSHIFTMAEKWGKRPDGSNPCRHVQRFEETKRERFLSGEELARLGAALMGAEKAGKLTPWGLAAIRLLIFTGARASEILGLTWDAVDLAAGALRMPRKGRLSMLYLNPPAQTVLANLTRMKDNAFVIVGGRIGKALTLSGLEQVWQEVRDAAKLEDVRLHDLRHSFASVAMAGGASLPVIGALLGHTQPATTARYAHLAADPMKAAAGAVGQQIATAMKAKPKRERSNVATMRGRRR